ncbi:MAG: PHP domain-containing protein [Acidobacteriota bacterium]
MKLKVELHSHTNFDPCDPIEYSAEQLIEAAAAQGYQALAITCHDALQWSRDLEAYAASLNVLLLPGVEATIEGKHVLIYGIERFTPIPTFQALHEFRRANPKALILAPHPFFPGSTCMGTRLLAHQECFDGIEYCHFYSKAINFNQKAHDASVLFRKPLVGTGDVHFFNQLGKTYSYVYAREKSVSAVISAIKAGELELVTRPLTTLEFLKLTLQLERIRYKGVFYRAGWFQKPPIKTISSAEE